MRAWQVLICFVHFPEHGSMFFPKGAIGYDPQLIKPPSDYRGVNAPVWNVFIKRYGGGPQICRRELDIYAREE